MKVKLSEVTLEEIRQHRPDLYEQILVWREQRRDELEAEIRRRERERDEQESTFQEQMRQRDLRMAALAMKEELHLRRMTFPNIIATYAHIPASTKTARHFIEAVARCRTEEELYVYLAEVKRSFSQLVNQSISEEKKLDFGNGHVSDGEAEQLRRALLDE